MKPTHHIGKWLGLAAICFLACAAATAQTTYYVAPDGLDTRTGTDYWTNALATISHGVTHAALPGDTVLVSNGTYEISALITINNGIKMLGFDSSGVTGGGNSGDVVVKGNGATACFYLNHTGALLAGMTITNGVSVADGAGGVSTKGTVSNCVVTGCKAPSGGGVYIYDSGTVVTSTVSYNISTGSVSDAGGGGVLFRSANGRLLDSYIIGNSATNNGGGVHFSYAGVVSNCVVMNNYAMNNGGGLYVNGNSAILNTLINSNRSGGVPSSWGGGGLFLSDYSSERRVMGCRIINNMALAGGGVYLYRLAGLLSNCTVAGNTATTIGGGAACVNSYTSTQTLDNCLFSNNVAGTLGGGIHSFYMTRITNCVVVNNLAGNYAGGIHLHNDGAMRDCIVRGNTATNYGGGVSIANGSRMLNCEISGNQALTNHSGGVYASTLSSYVYGSATAYGYIGSCTIASNKASIYAGGMYITGVGSVTNTIIYGNSAAANPDIDYAAAAYSNYFWNCCSTRQLNQFQGNTMNNPLFLNAASGNFRLGRGSPCVNTGTNQDWMTNSVDLDNRTRIRYGTVDMGAYEHIYDATVYRAW